MLKAKEEGINMVIVESATGVYKYDDIVTGGGNAGDAAGGTASEAASASGTRGTSSLGPEGVPSSTPATAAAGDADDAKKSDKGGVDL